MIRPRCSVPIYVVSQSWFETGIAVGGSIRSGQFQGAEAGKMALQILQGENAGDIPVIQDGPYVYMFDYSQLKRFGIALSALPEGSIVVNKPESFYFLYKRQTFVVGAVVAGLVLVAAALSINVIRWKLVEKKLLRYQRRLKSLAQDLSVSEDRQRKRIAIELMNCITEPLMISKLNVEELLQNACPDSFGKKISEVCECLDQTIQDTRLLTFDLSSPILYETSFETAVSEWLSEQIDRRYGIRCEFKNDGKVEPLSKEAGLVLFRIIRELLINVVKHSHASNVKVSLTKVDNCLHINVSDNGIGFDPSKASSMPTQKGGFGLFSIRERLERMNGRIEIDSAPGKGTSIKIIAPLS
jgi:signal transduction histidine kinase